MIVGQELPDCAYRIPDQRDPQIVRRCNRTATEQAPATGDWYCPEHLALLGSSSEHR